MPFSLACGARADEDPEERAPEVVIMHPIEGDWDKLYQCFEDKLSQEESRSNVLGILLQVAGIAVQAAPVPGVAVVSGMLGWLASYVDSSSETLQQAQHEAVRIKEQVKGIRRRLEMLTSPDFESTREIYRREMSETLLVLRYCLEKRILADFEECCDKIKQLDEEMQKDIVTIKAVNNNVQQIYYSSSSSISRDNRPKRLRGDVSDYVGLASQVANLKKEILSGQSAVGLVALKAMGGIGKTTLASAVCDDDNIKKEFDHVCWVEVKKDPSPRDICNLQEELCRQLGHVVSVKDRKDGEQKLGTYLQKNKVLLVLDNMWNIEDMPCDVRDLKSGCLLLTTRNATVAQAAGASIVELDLMSEDSSLELLCRKAGLQGISLELEAQLRIVAVEWCGRLPLALEVVGANALASGQSRDLRWWENKVQEWGTNTSVIGKDVEKRQTFKQDCLLRLSYDAASPREKVVFQWLVAFRDHDLAVSDGRLCEAIAALLDLTEYEACSVLRGLANRSLVRWMSDVSKMSVWLVDEVMFIHDLLRDVADEVLKGNRVLKGASVGKALHVTIDDDKQLHWEGWRTGIASISSLWLYIEDASPFLNKILCLKHLRVLCIRSKRHIEVRDFLCFGRRQRILVELSALTNLLQLDLAKNDIDGSIPPELSALTHLFQLDLSYNSIHGSIPPELSTLTNLKYLILGGNWLSGCIPPELSALTNLKHLDLSFNNLSGNIPPELSGLTNLEVLFLSSNKLSGSIPPELSALTNIKSLDLFSNQLSGSIPRELSALVTLTSLHLSSNELSGSIPPELSHLTNLERLDLSFNQLSGSIPPELSRLRNLKRLYLFSNQLSGSIPPELSDLEI